MEDFSLFCLCLQVKVTTIVYADNFFLPLLLVSIDGSDINSITDVEVVNAVAKLNTVSSI